MKSLLNKIYRDDIRNGRKIEYGLKQFVMKEMEGGAESDVLTPNVMMFKEKTNYLIQTQPISTTEQLDSNKPKDLTKPFDEKPLDGKTPSDIPQDAIKPVTSEVTGNTSIDKTVAPESVVPKPVVP